MTVLIVFGIVALLVGAYFALDWWLAGRAAKRSLSLPRARDGQQGNADVDYDLIKRQSEGHGTGL